MPNKILESGCFLLFSLVRFLKIKLCICELELTVTGTVTFNVDCIKDVNLKQLKIILEIADFASPLLLLKHNQK